MEGRKGIACLVGMALLACACAPYSRTSTAVSAPSPAPAPASETDRQLERLLAYAERSRAFTAETLKAEYAAASKAQRGGPTAEASIRLAILLSHPRAPFRNEARARQLLRQALREPGVETGGLRPLARLLYRRVVERAALERERARRVELQGKLEQLKTIEQEIDRRVPSPVVPEPQ